MSCELAGARRDPAVRAPVVLALPSPPLPTPARARPRPPPLPAGANSQVRAAMQAADPSLAVDVADSGRQYYTFHSIPPAKGMSPAGAAADKDISSSASGGSSGGGQELHLFASGDPRSMLSAHTSCNEPTFSGMVALEAGGFDDLATKEDFEGLLARK